VIRRRREREEDGVSTVEFALVFPLFILLVGIAVYFGYMYYAQTQVDRAASRAARYAAVPATDGSYAYCQSLILKQVQGDVFTSKVELGDVTISDGTGKVVTGYNPAGSVPDVCTTVPSGFVKVKVIREFGNPFSIILAPFGVGGSGLTVTGTGQVRVEHS
jgi:Flp pilus assembly protein TadG